MARPQYDPRQAAIRLADCLERQLGVSGVEIDDVRAPDGGHSANMALFTARWQGDDGPESHKLVARIEQGDLALVPDYDLMFEWRLMKGLANTAIPVPPLWFTETGSDILGRPFYVMGHVEGRVVQDEPPYHVDGWLKDECTEEQRAELWYQGVDLLAQLHNVDYRKELRFLEHPQRGATGLDQHLHWMRDWYRWVMDGEAHPIADAALRYVLDDRPAGTQDSVLWGDARIGNLLISDEVKVAAVIDWEMGGLGPGELDLAWWISMDHLLGPGLLAPRLPGLPSRDETIARYERTRGRPVSDFRYYEILAVLRFATILILAGKMFRGPLGLAEDSTFGTHSHAMRYLAELMGLPLPEVSADCMRNHRPDLAPEAYSAP